MIEVYDRIFVGTEEHCSSLPSEEWAIIHACKHPCHRGFVSYTNNLSASHPHYLIYEEDNNLVLNMVDMENELSAKFTNPIFSAALTFIRKQIILKSIFIHCNQGRSRSPSIALTYLAASSMISNDSYRTAATDFMKIYPSYDPGNGIKKYLEKNWKTIITF